VFLTEFTSPYGLNTQRGWHTSEFNMPTGLQIALTGEHNLSFVLQTAGYIYSKHENAEYKYMLLVVTDRMFHNSFREYYLSAPVALSTPRPRSQLLTTHQS